MNGKSGSGKSTSALNLAANLACRLDKSVLLVDLDHQANVTAAMTDGPVKGNTLTQVLIENVPAEDAILHTTYQYMALLPADVNIALADSSGRLGLGRETRLQQALSKIDEMYDYVIIDTGPQRNLLNINVLNYVDEVLVPIDPGYWSVMGVRGLEELIGEVRRHMNRPQLHINGVLLTKVQHTNVAREVEKQVRDYFGDLVFDATIPLNVKVEEAHSRGLAVLDYAPESSGALGYAKFTREFIENEQKR